MECFAIYKSWRNGASSPSTDILGVGAGSFRKGMQDFLARVVSRVNSGGCNFIIYNTVENAIRGTPSTRGAFIDYVYANSPRMSREVTEELTEEIYFATLSMPEGSF